LLYRNPLRAQIGTLPGALTNSASQNCSYVRSRLVSSQEQACDCVNRASGARSGLYPGVSAYGSAGGESACTLVDVDVHATFAWPSPCKELLSSSRNRVLPDEPFRSVAAGEHVFLCSRRVELHWSRTLASRIGQPENGGPRLIRNPHRRQRNALFMLCEKQQEHFAMSWC